MEKRVYLHGHLPALTLHHHEYGDIQNLLHLSSWLVDSHHILVYSFH